MIYTTFLSYIWRKKIIYILYFLKFFINILYLLIAENGEVSPGFPVGQLTLGSAEMVHFVGISYLGNWAKFLYFLQWLSLSFVFVSMFVICLSIYLFIYYCYYHFLFIYLFIYFCLVLIRHIHFCWCELL